MSATFLTVECPSCGGSGKTMYLVEGEDPVKITLNKEPVTCPYCKGIGTIPVIYSSVDEHRPETESVVVRALRSRIKSLEKILYDISELTMKGLK